MQHVCMVNGKLWSVLLATLGTESIHKNFAFTSDRACTKICLYQLISSLQTHLNYYFQSDLLVLKELLLRMGILVLREWMDILLTN